MVYNSARDTKADIDSHTKKQQNFWSEYWWIIYSIHSMFCLGKILYINLIYQIECVINLKKIEQKQ